jgi:hypothetical protein
MRRCEAQYWVIRSVPRCKTFLELIRLYLSEYIQLLPLLQQRHLHQHLWHPLKVPSSYQARHPSPVPAALPPPAFRAAAVFALSRRMLSLPNLTPFKLLIAGGTASLRGSIFITELSGVALGGVPTSVASALRNLVTCGPCHNWKCRIVPCANQQRQSGRWPHQMARNTPACHLDCF